MFDSVWNYFFGTEEENPVVAQAVKFRKASAVNTFVKLSVTASVVSATMYAFNAYALGVAVMPVFFTALAAGLYYTLALSPLVYMFS